MSKNAEGTAKLCHEWLLLAAQLHSTLTEKKGEYSPDAEEKPQKNFMKEFDKILNCKKDNSKGIKKPFVLSFFFLL